MLSRGPPAPTPLALKDLSKKLQVFHCGSLKNAKLVNVSKHQKVQSCFSFFALKKKVLKNHCIAEKFLSKMIFKEKKFVYSNERKLVWLFVKKIEHQTIKMYVWKKDCKNKKDNKKKEMFTVSIFYLKKKKKKVKKKMQCSRSWSVVENLFLSAWKIAENISEKRCLRSWIQS